MSGKKGSKRGAYSMPMKGLARMDYPRCRTVGWYARIYLVGKRIKAKYFADKSNGGKIKAGEKARAWLRIYNEIYRDEISPVVYRVHRQSNNRTGKTGVYQSFSRKKCKDKTHYYYYYAATWNKNGGGKHKRFFIHKYPSAGDAFFAACEYRRLIEQRMDMKENL